MSSKFKSNIFAGKIGDIKVSDIPTSYKVDGSVTTEPSTPPPQTNVENSGGNNSEADKYKPTEHNPNMDNVKHFSKNKTMTYAGTQAQSASVKDLQSISERLDKYVISKSLDRMPPGYYDNAKYQHRIDADAMTNPKVSRDIGIDDDNCDPDRMLRIGDCCFVIPPEFISVTTSTSHEAIQGIRHSGSMYIKNGFSRKEIQIQLVLNGMDQINGYEVTSPLPGVTYYVDGLRALLSQFKFTPFLPIQNNIINIVHGVSNVALRNINVETIQGFPETLSVTLTLQEFNIQAVCPHPNDWFNDCIDWDLFRWYTQRPLIGHTKTKYHKITTPNLTHDFKFKILSQDALSKSAENDYSDNNAIQNDELRIDLTDDKNYETVISSQEIPGKDGKEGIPKKDIQLTYVSFNVGNIMPVIQMSSHESPFMQYMGSTDTSFTFGFQTKDLSAAQLFNNLNRENSSIVRNNRFANGIGFIKIENELVKLTGTEFLIMSDINVTTVPDFPGLFNITVQCLSYDSNQANREKLVGLRPFDGNRKGTRDDLITQYKDGVAEKIKQDCAIERQIQEIELYPDLELPKYGQVDDVISKIREHRDAIGTIEQLPYTKYPRHACSLPGSPYDTEYNGYVDPDFYTFSPMKNSDHYKNEDSKIDPSIKEMFKGPGDNVGVNPFSIPKGFIEPSNVSESYISNKLTNIIVSGKADTIMDLFFTPKVVPDVATEPKYTYGWETNIRTRVHKGFLSEDDKTGSGSSNSSGGGYVEGPATAGSGAGADPTSVNKRYGNPFLDLLCDRADSGCGYVWGADGQILTQSTLDSFKRTHGSGEYTGENDVSHWMGKQVFDCSGFICWGLRKVGLKGSGWRIVAASFGGLGTKVSQSELQPGDICYHGTHCAVYIGDGKTVEASNSRAGVKYGKINSKYAYVRPSGLSDANNKFLQSNPNFYKTVKEGNGNNLMYSASTENRESRISDVTPRSMDSKEISNYAGQQQARPISRPPHDGMAPPGYGGGTSYPSNNNNSNNNSDSDVVSRTGNETILGNFGNGDPCDKWNDLIIQHSKTHNFDPNFIKTIIKIESSGNPNAVSGYVDAGHKIVGLMQVNQRWFKIEGNNPFDPSMNIKRGCQTWAEYGVYSYVKYDKKRWLCAYNAGIGYCKWVYVDKTHSLPSETAKYYEKYDKYYNQLIANGGRAGNTITPTDGGMTAPNGTGNYEVGPNGESKPGFQLNEADYTNPNSGKNHGDKVSTINVAKFGKDFLEEIAIASKFRNVTINNVKVQEADKFDFDIGKMSESIKLANDPAHALEYMAVDMDQYSCKGLLVRAFPSYLLVFLDEQQEWCDSKKLWTNYYVCRSAIDINVFEDYSSPSKIAKVSLTNFHNNLTHAMRSMTNKDMMDGVLKDGFRRIIYDTTGAIFDEQITDKMIDLKNDLYEETQLNEGARIHIRMGYGSNPARYPTVFNGTITDISEGEVVEFVAQSDGRELISTPVTDKTSATNKDIGLSEEVSNMIAELLIKRESEFLYAFTFGNFKLRSAYGIEHFGQHFYKLNPMNHVQYDLVKNIYKGNYSGVPFCRSPFNPMDGEANFRFMATGKTVWDMFKMCEKAMPDFIAYPRDFGFETRMFYGLPQWLYKYKYNYDTKSHKVYEHAKSFTQMHEAHSLDSIIDNTIKVNTRGHITNAIGVYTLGGDLSTTPVIMSDKHIDSSRQSTKTFDTTSVQDFSWVPGFIDKLLSWTGTYDNGKNLAIRVCVAELMDSWKNTYDGSLLIIGQGEIKAHDWVMVSDLFLSLEGMISVRQVCHSMSVGSGYTTSITPGMITSNTLKNSNLNNVYRSAFSVLVYTKGQKTAQWVGTQTYNRAKDVYTAAKNSEYAQGAIKNVKNFMNGKGKEIYTSVKNGKVVTKSVDFVKSIDKLQDGIKLVKGSKALATAGKVGKGVMAICAAVTPAGWAAIAGTIAIDIVASMLFTWVIDMFKYDNTITIMPLIRKTPSGKSLAFAGNIRGSKTLMPVDKSANADQDLG